MSRGLTILDAIVPKDYGAKTTNDARFFFLYTKNLVNPILEFVQRLKTNWDKKFKGLPICTPYITWTPKSTPLSMHCGDNINIMKALRGSEFGNMYQLCCHYIYQVKRVNGSYVKTPNGLTISSNIRQCKCKIDKA